MIGQECPLPWSYDPKESASGGLGIIRDADGCRVCHPFHSDANMIVNAVNGAMKRRETLKAKDEQDKRLGLVRVGKGTVRPNG